jgi:predicted methyltransferase
VRRTLAAGLILAVMCGASAIGAGATEAPIFGKQPAVHLGDIGLGMTEETKPILETMLQGVEEKSHEKLTKALAGLTAYVKGKPYAGEYAALRWFCDLLLMSDAARQEQLPDPVTEVYYRSFTSDEAKQLKEYLGRNFHLRKYKDEDPRKGLQIALFLQNQLILNFPGRDEYENSAEVLRIAGIKEGTRVADIGCGPGYYVPSLAKAVGEKGVVYAVDVSEEAVTYVRNFARSARLQNVKGVLSMNTNACLPEPVDVVFMSSLYQRIYSCLNEEDRRALMGSIWEKLRPQEGRLVIVENAPVEDDAAVPWSTISKELIVAQLSHWGFRLETARQVSSFRYVLVFSRQPGRVGPTTAEPSDVSLSLRPPQGDHAVSFLDIDTDVSLIHIAGQDSFEITPNGIQAAKYILDYIHGGMQSLSLPTSALEIYAKLVPKENYGGEYTALQWFCEYFCAEEGERAKMLADPLVKSYFHFFADNQCAVLREYLELKYKLKDFKPQDLVADQDRRAFLEDLVLFNNPKRETWEKTAKIMALLPIKKGDKIADIGCGPGYYDTLFSAIVGKEGRIYALDTKPEHIDFLKQFVKETGMDNIVPIVSKETDICVSDKIDVAYMCSLYHIIYGLSTGRDRDAFIGSIRSALKETGLLIIVDNCPVKVGELPYHGPYIAKELTIAQVEQFGFKLLKYEQIVPQRYLLIFEKAGQ